MNDLDTTDPLDAIVGDALRADAEQAPQLPDAWPGIDRMSIAPAAPDRPRHLTVIVGVAAAVVVVASLAVVVNSNGNDSNDVASTGSWSPDGTEFALTDLGPATEVTWNTPAVAALTRKVAVENHPPLVIATSLTYAGTDTAVEQRCVDGGCRPEWNTSSWSYGTTSSIDNRIADFDLWFVEGLPTSTAFVSYTDGDVRLWQRPIVGVAAFPDVAGTNEIVVAYDSAGTELGQFGPGEYTSTTTDPLRADLSTSQFHEFGELTHDSMTSCLVDNGGTIGGGGVATFADGQDQITIWDQCVASVKQIVADALDEIDPRFYDPTTESPENPDPAIVETVIVNPPSSEPTTQPGD